LEFNILNIRICFGFRASNFGFLIDFLPLRKNQSNAQGVCKKFEYFQIFSNIFKRFTSFFEYFQTFSIVFERFQTQLARLVALYLALPAQLLHFNALFLT